MSLLGLILQESEVRDTEARTIGGFLREKMDGERRRRTVKRRLRLRCIVCCGATCGSGSTPVNFHDGDADEEETTSRNDQPREASPVSPQAEPSPGLGCLNQAPVSSGMNLAAALAAERHFRATPEPDGEELTAAPGTPLRMSLIRLLEEADGKEESGGGGESRSETVCCVCMIRKKGAAFIPCGHTFCRICSRELWLNRGSCPLCNRSIIEILDITAVRFSIRPIGLCEFQIQTGSHQASSRSIGMKETRRIVLWGGGNSGAEASEVEMWDVVVIDTLTIFNCIILSCGTIVTVRLGD